MTYYPSSQIQTNLHTNGGEYILETTRETYKGYFYKTSNGSKYTGKTPDTPPNILLLNINPQQEFGTPQPLPTTNLNTIDLFSNPNGNDYTLLDFQINTTLLDITKYKGPNIPQHRSIPSSNLTIPTTPNYESGRFLRYFTKKNNELKYMEINKETHDQLKSRELNIAWDLYSPITVIWTLTGEQEQVFLTNKKIVALAEKRNKWYGFSQWFKDNFLKYYLAS